MRLQPLQIPVQQIPPILHLLTVGKMKQTRSTQKVKDLSQEIIFGFIWLQNSFRLTKHWHKHTLDLKTNKQDIPERAVNGDGGEGLASPETDEVEGEGTTWLCLIRPLLMDWLTRWIPFPLILLAGDADMEVDSDGEGAADVEAAPKIKKKVLKGPAESKSKKEHINVVFIGHVGMSNGFDSIYEVSSMLDT